MSFIFQPWQLYIAIIAGWIHRQQQEAIDYLRAENRVLRETRYGRDLAKADHVDLAFLEKYWIDRFTFVPYETIMECKMKIDELMKNFHVFGSAVSEET